MGDVKAALGDLKDRYCALHTAKEDLFWESKMGLSDDAADCQRRGADAEKKWNAFLQDPARLEGLRSLEAAAADDEEREITGGWIAMLAAHVVESPEGRRLSEEIVEREADLATTRGAMKLGYRDPGTGEQVRASSNRLALMARTHEDPAVRKAAWEGLRSVEGYVLDNGFLEIVKLRNRLARSLGFEDYYDWRVQVVERMSKKRLFETLDDLAQRTQESTDRALAAFSDKHGDGALDPWNFSYLRSGSITEKLDPYFGFGCALRRWGRSFHALGVRYRGATLTLDLVDRDGKYENGFMHGPEPAFVDNGEWRPARINFTANAVVGQKGAGHRAINTLFHEGGHAAHFSNIAKNAPCFSQEFAPTSVGYAETQSMFMDSLVEDAAWQTRYAVGPGGAPMPFELIEEVIREQQPFKGWDQRAMLTVPFAERALYEIPDDELTPDRVLETFREVESRLQGLSSGTRPVLAVPHLLAGESSAYYHGYVLAEMAVYQTRNHFLERDGYLTDNPRIGPELTEKYWAPGNSQTFDQTIEALTGQPLSADALVDAANALPEDVIDEARRGIARMTDVPTIDGPVELDATIRVMHGRELVATTEGGTFESACEAFESWIRQVTAAAT
ncbi:MAG: peptidase M3 [Deltaproteobacteria bacterium]|nr:MAG: peptidase M3 [Deltaproteobacteria bacterium]